MVDYEKEVEAATSPALSTTASSDHDENYKFYRQNRGIEYTPEEAKKTLRKIDKRLIPLLFIIYMIQVRASRGARNVLSLRMLIASSIWIKTASTLHPCTVSKKEPISKGRIIRG
jgi:hypothetical protein